MIFMPYRDYRRSAKCLSSDHLMAQRLACRRIIGVMFSRQRTDYQDWMKDWLDHGDAVLHATDATLEEMKRRRLKGPFGVCPWMLRHGTQPPPWLGSRDYHDAVRARLLRLDPSHYGRMGW